MHHYIPFVLLNMLSYLKNQNKSLNIKDSTYSGSTMGDYMRPKTAPGSEGGENLFTLRSVHLFLVYQKYLMFCVKISAFYKSSFCKDY